jgi:hypothetical protein
MDRRRLLALLISAGGFIAGSVAGCGTSETTTELTPEAKKTVFASKVGDESKFKKTGKGAVGTHR